VEINHRQEGSVTIVSILGSLDAMTSPDLNEFFKSQFQAGNVRLVIDLAALDYTSSAGLRAMLSAVKEARAQGGDVRLAASQPNVKKIFEMSGFTNIIKFYPDVASAVASF
jgi:anti-sigma B factor antagonist